MDKTEGIDTQVSHFEGRDHLSFKKLGKKFINLNKRLLVPKPMFGHNQAIALLKKKGRKKFTPLKKIASYESYETDHILKKLRKKAKKAIKKVGSGIKKGVKAVGKVLKAGALLPLLLPIKPVMVKALKAKKVKPKKGLEALAKQFYTVVVQKKSSYETDHLAPLAALIPPIISFVKNMIAKKKSGAAITDPGDMAVADEGDVVLEKLETKAAIENVPDVQVQAASSAPGSNIKVPESAPDDSGIAESDQKDKARKRKRRKASGGGNSGGGKLSFSNPLVIGGAIAALIVIVLVIKK